MLKIKKWEQYQSYKDRKPPWIRLNRLLLDDYEFQSMSDAAQAILPMLWLLASEDQDPVSGLIRIGYEKIAFRLRKPEEKIKKTIEEIIRAGFIVDISDSNESVTNPLQNRNETVPPETETETETENKEISPKKNLGEFEEFWKLWPLERRCEKPKALSAWKDAIKKSDSKIILTALSGYLQTKEVREGFAPYPAKWLKAERWFEIEQLIRPTASREMIIKNLEWKRNNGLLLTTEQESMLNQSQEQV